MTNRYLKPTPTIECELPAVRQLARDLTRSLDTDRDRATGLFYFVRDEIRYNHFGPVHHADYFRAGRTLPRGEGNCIQKAVLLAALCRAVGIPVRLRFADFLNFRMADNLVRRIGSNRAVYHGYNELLLDGQWVKATAAFDLETCRRQGFIPVDFDGRRDALLPRLDLDGNRFAEYVEERGHHDDLPLEEITATWLELYGPEWRTLFEPEKTD